MRMQRCHTCLIVTFLWFFLSQVELGLAQENRSPEQDSWPLWIIDNSSSGADGIRLADINSDGLPDIVTGWEESGITRVYINPGPSRVREHWPAVTVGPTQSVEDAVFADLDGDGALEVVSSCEGSYQTILVHWSPLDSTEFFVSGAWRTDVIPASRLRSQWMFALPAQVDGELGLDLVVGSKGERGIIGWFESPRNPQELADWKLNPIYEAGWIMSLIDTDLDGDGDVDVIASDRKGPRSGVLWLENPGRKRSESRWAEYRIGVGGREVMFLDFVDMNGDEREDLLAAVKPQEFHLFLQPEDPRSAWPSRVITVRFPAGIGFAKGVAGGDIDLDGRNDVVFSCEGAEPPRRGVVWFSVSDNYESGVESVYDVSGPEGIKFDLVELVDLDHDGDLDVLTCEENGGLSSKGLGVIWYENPYR